MKILNIFTIIELINVFMILNPLSFLLLFIILKVKKDKNKDEKFVLKTLCCVTTFLFLLSIHYFMSTNNIIKGWD